MKKILHQLVFVFTHFLTPVRLIVITSLTAFFWFVVLGDKGIYELRKLSKMKGRLESERRTLGDDIDRLSEEKKNLTDPARLEMPIRKELGYIKPGEVVFEEKKEPASR